MKTLLIGILFMCCFAGCENARVVPVRQPNPLIERPSRPQLETMTKDELLVWNALPADLRNKLIKNNDELQAYAKEMEITIDTYNKWADTVNRLNEKFLGLAPEKPELKK